MNLAANICNDILNGHFVADINGYFPEAFDGNIFVLEPMRQRAALRILKLQY
jgi:hypothetical protein